MDLLIAEVKRYPSVNTLRKALHKMPSELDKTYDKYMDRILRSDSAAHAKDVLSWVLLAREQVEIQVLQEAISLQWSPGQIDDVLDPSDLLGYCIGLITEKASSKNLKIVAFVHSDMERYFRRPDKIKEWFPDSQLRIADSCLRCLLLDLDDLTNSPLWSYATRYWGHHIEDKYAELEPMISTYLSQTEKVSFDMQHSMQEPGLSMEKFGKVPFKILCQHPVPSKCHGCHAAAFFGIWEYTCAAEQGGIDCKDSNGWTPIWWAILGGHDVLVKQLLNKGAETNMKSSKNIPLVIWMLGIGQWRTRGFQMINCTFGSNCTVISGGRYFWSKDISYLDTMRKLGPKTWPIASPKSTFQVIKTLAGDVLNSTDDDGNSVLMTAAMLWQFDVVHQLIDQGADISLKNNSGSTAFMQALRDWTYLWRYEDLSFKEQAKISIGDYCFILPTTTLNPYSFGKLEAVVGRTLVELIPEDFDVNSVEGRLALRLAINNRHMSVVHELLERGADPNAETDLGATPLMWACMPPVRNHIYISGWTLGDHGTLYVGTFASSTEVDTYEEMTGTTHMIESGPIALSHDITDYSEFPQRDFEFIVRMLLDKGADIDAEIDGHTALEFAAENEYLTIFRTLLAAGADITRVNYHYIERLRKILREDEGYGGKFGLLCVDTLRDFQTHDYCILLLNLMIPQSIPHVHDNHFLDYCTLNLRSVFYFNSPLRLSSGLTAESSSNVQTKWSAQKEYKQRVAKKLNTEPVELLYMIEKALRRGVCCRRDEFWAFGDWGPQFQDDVQLEAWSQHLPWLVEWVYRGLTGITTYEVPILMVQVPSSRWILPGQGIIEPYRVGLTKRTEFWMFPRTSCRNIRRFGHLLLKSLLIWRHFEKTWEGGTADF